MPTLYRKYRPQTFADITGQEHIVQTIMSELSSDQIAHAYLFSGPRGVGKTTIARLLAKALNCTDRKKGASEPCDKCDSCREITAGRNIDVIEIDAASHTGVDSVRENIVENAQFKPTRSKYKIFIIDEVHMLSTSSFNALLKTLEEPPAHVVFILATTELHKLPATIISRCQRFNFKKIAYDDMLKRLKNICAEEKIKVNDDVLDRIVRKSEGGLRDAESLLGQIFSLNLKKITAEDAELILPVSKIEGVLDFVECLADKNSAAALAQIQKLVADGLSVDQFFNDLIEVLRQLMMSSAGQKMDQADFSDEAAKKIKELAKKFSPSQIVVLLDRCLKRRLETKNAPIPELPLELLVVEYCADKPDNDDKPTPSAPAETPQESKSATKIAAKETKSTLTSTIKHAFETISHKTAPKTTLAEVTAKWDEVITKISEHYPSLVFILKMCQPVGLDENGLKVNAPFTLHRDKLNEAKNRKSIESVLENMFGENITFQAQVAAAPAAEKVPAGELQDLAAEFGGEVMN